MIKTEGLVHDENFRPIDGKYIFFILINIVMFFV